MNLPRLINTIARTRATADCTIRASGSAIKACERLAREISVLPPAEKGLLDISFTYRYHRSCVQQEVQQDRKLNDVLNAVHAAKQCLVSARMRCAATSATLENALHNECVGLCCFEDEESKTTHLVAANSMGAFVWQLSHGGEDTAATEKGNGSGEIVKGENDGDYISDVILIGLAAALQVESWGTEFELIPGLSIEEPDSAWAPSVVGVDATANGHPVDALLEGKAEHVVFGLRGWNYGRIDMPLPPGTLVFPGSFNPLHHGHRGAVDAALASVAANGERVPGHAYEISAEHPDKGLLKKEEIQTRVEQFTGIAPVIVSRAALYVKKTERYPLSKFLIGTDVMRKILHPKYCGGSVARMNAELERMRSRGCKFLVAGRKDEVSGVFETAESVLREVMVSPEDRAAVQDMFVPIEGFRVDVSSSAIRAGRAQVKL